MKIHRFYAPWIQESDGEEYRTTDQHILRQWNNVLRFREGQRVRLFDGNGTELICDLKQIARNQAVLTKIADAKPSMPVRDIHLFWALLKKTNNELVLQKATELGVTHFHPIVSERSEKRGVSDAQYDRWTKICIEASEQSGRGDIPVIAGVQDVRHAVAAYKDSVHLYIAEQQLSDSPKQLQYIPSSNAVGGFVGPEGGWSKQELDFCAHEQLSSLRLSGNTLRAETAAIMLAGTLARHDVT